MAPSSRSIRRPRTGLRTSAIRVNCLVEDLSIAVRRLGVIGAGPSTREGGLSVRRVVTEEVGGRSRILADGPAPQTGAAGQVFIEELWITEAASPLGHDPTPDDVAFAPSGGARWRIFSIPPDKVMRELLAAQQTDGEVTVDADGWHRTNTIDFVVLLDGDITLSLDDGEVVLHPGDYVVQRATNHAWHNYNDTPVRLLAVLMGLP